MVKWLKSADGWKEGGKESEDKRIRKKNEGCLCRGARVCATLTCTLYSG